MTRRAPLNNFDVLSILLALSNNPDRMTVATFPNSLTCAQKRFVPYYLHTMTDQILASYSENFRSKFVDMVYSPIDWHLYHGNTNMLELWLQEKLSRLSISVICPTAFWIISDVLSILQEVDSWCPAVISFYPTETPSAYCTSLGKSIV